MEVEVAAGGADAHRVERVLRGLIGAVVGIRHVAFSLACAVSGNGGIDLTCAECCGNREGIGADVLYPGDAALVVVQLIADASIGQVLYVHLGYGAVSSSSPQVGDVVVVRSAIGTVGVVVCIVALHVDELHVARIAGKAIAGTVGDVEVAVAVDGQTVHDAGLAAGPANHAAAVLRACALDVELCQTILDDGARRCPKGDGAVCGIAIPGAVDLHVNIAAADNAPRLYGDGCCPVAAGGNLALHLQVLDDTLSAYPAEESNASRLRFEVDGDGVAGTVEDTFVLNGIGANHRRGRGLDDVCRQQGIGKAVSLIHKGSELFQVFCRTNLIDTIHLGKCPCSCADNAQKRYHTQIQ